MSTVRRSRVIAMTISLVALMVLVFTQGCSKEPAWTKLNNQLIKENDLQGRGPREDMPETGVIPNVGDGKVVPLDTLAKIELAKGVTGKMYWGHGNLINWVTLEPGAEIPEETLTSERIMVVMEGSVEQMINGSYKPMISIPRTTITGTNGVVPRNDFVYLKKGSKNAMRAGQNGAKILEAYWPVRLDYLEKAGVANIPSSIPELSHPIKPSVDADKIYDLQSLQFTELVSDADSRLIAGEGVQLSFITMWPGSKFGLHFHPEEQLMIVLRGYIDEGILDGVTVMNKDDVLFLPGNMVHSGLMPDVGCDALDVFWAPRQDYTDKMNATYARYHKIIPKDAEVELVVDGATQGPGLTFTEGPSWMNGKLYFSSMYFSTEWAGDPKKSALVEMDPDGTYRYISHGKMQTNGTMPMGNGNLAVCDMFGHRVVEMNTRGRVLRTLVNQYNGKRIDGPNDLVIDAKGGIYFTDPQFIPDERQQEGRAVYYRRPDGEVIRVTKVGDFGMPNGVLLSPDGKTLYINNTYHDDAGWNSPAENYLWAFDVNEDGTISNGRKHTRLFLTPDQFDAKTKSTSADGMTIDTDGNIYVCTMMGVQICAAEGGLIGNINTPIMPVSCCFGDDDMKTLYLTCYDKIYKIRTNVTGLTYPLGN